jgi:AcrR family transcriptional regulator
MTSPDAITSEASEEDQRSCTRRRLLDAAIHIASTQGLDKVTYRSVGTQAGLSHSLVRFYFGTGDAMVTQALERAAQLDVAQSQIRSESIQEFGAELLRLMAEERNRVMLQYDYLLRALRGRVPIERLVSLYDFYIGEVAATLEQVGIEDADGSTAGLVLAALDGLILQHAVYGSEEHTEAVLDKLRDVLRLLRPPGGNTG